MPPAESSPEATSAGQETGAAAGIPAGAVALSAGWIALNGPSNVPADGDPKFGKFVTGESSFQHLSSWSNDNMFGITTDPETGKTMQQVAQGTEEKDADGISMAFAFFAETDEGKYGSDPAKVKAAIAATQEKLAATPAAELPKYLVGHKCVSDFQSSTPETREFRRGMAWWCNSAARRPPGMRSKPSTLFFRHPVGNPATNGDQRPQELLGCESRHA